MANKLRAEMISDIEALALVMADRDDTKARKLIRRWSTFIGAMGDTVTIENRNWDQVSDSWLLIIQRKARQAYGDWKLKRQNYHLNL